MQKIFILVLILIILCAILFIPPFHWTIIGAVMLVISTLCGFITTLVIQRNARLMQKKRKIGIITGILVFLLLTVQVLQVFTPLNVITILLLGISLLAL